MGSNPTALLRPSFFIPLINNNSTKLKLPIRFVRKHRNFLPEKAALRIGTGKIWNVKIEEYSDDDEEGCFSTEGWSDFVRDLDLQNMQMLVFSLNTDEAILDVTVYEANANEREFSAVDFPLPGSNNVNYIDLEESESEGESERGEEESESDGESRCGDESRPRFEFVLTENQRSRMVLPKEFATEAGLNGKEGVVLQFEAQERYWPAFLEQRTTASLHLAAGWNDFIADNQLVFGTSYSFEFDSPKSLILVSICRSEPSTSAGNGEKTWRFVKKLKEYNFSNLRMEMPKAFATSSGIKRKDYVELENSQGMRWRVGVTSRNIQMFSMTQGWLQFLRENNLQVGSILLFELVADSENIVKVMVMENEVGKYMLARARKGGLIWF